MQAVSAKSEASNDLRSRRRALGISQQAVAVAAECSVSAVRLLEGGYSPSKSAVRDRIVQVLDAELARRWHAVESPADAGGSRGPLEAESGGQQ